MKCPICGADNADGAAFCTNCGGNMAGSAPQPQSAQGPQSAPQPQGAPGPQGGFQQPNGFQQPYYAPQPYVDPNDHTSEFDAKDISDNKVFALSAYLFGWMGIIVAIIAAKDSKFANFHVRTALKFSIVETLILLIGALLCWTFIVPIVAGIAMCVVAVIEIIAFVNACCGKAKDPALIRELKFLK